MTLLQMTYLMEVERCGSINRAAKNLFITQSALSSAIAEAEKELGIVIFHRSNRGITLTDEGRGLITQIAPLVDGFRKITRYYSERRAENRVRLSIASQRYPFCAKAFVEFLHLLNEPHLEVSLKEMEMSGVINEVASLQSQLGILFVSDMTEHFILRLLAEKHREFRQLSTVRPRVFLRKGHPLSGREAVELEELYQYPYAMFTQNDLNLNFAEEAVVGTAVDFDQVVYVNDRATIYNIMAHTNCVSTGSGLLPDGYGDDRLTSIPLSGNVYQMRLGYIHPKGLPLGPLEEQFVTILRNILDQVG